VLSFEPQRSERMATTSAAELALAGTLLGVLIAFAGQFLIQWRLVAWQREHWTRDSKKAEWRELIGTLCQSARCMLNNWYNAAFDIEPDPEDMARMQRLWSDADSEAIKTIQDRIFIADQMQKEGILERWQKLAISDGDMSRFEKGWNEFHAALVKAAQDDLKI
jgi:hypothetical protein